MTFSDVIQDIRKLVGLELQSIRPGATITIIDVDEEKSCLNLRTAQGHTRSRPLSELQTIWNELNRLPAVHVEGVLHGSGTSRNQPETILANLPYIEWLKLDNKKHISLVNRNTHAYGTLKQMDAIAAAEIASHTKSGAASGGKAQIVIVSPDVGNTSACLQASFPGKLATVERGVYAYESTTAEILIIAAGHTELAPGCYTVLPATAVLATRTVDICDEDYYVIDDGGIKLLIRK